MSNREMKLGVFAVGTGNHVAGWRHPGATQHGESVSTFIEIGQMAESAKLDFMFLADNLQCAPGDHPGFISRLEPFTTLSAVAATTKSIGLVASGSTSWSAPYNLARLVGSLDHISGGRAGWNLVTTNTPRTALNFGGKMEEHDKRYEIAEEFITVVRGLWDSWEPDAKVLNTLTGEYLDQGKIHPLNHEGQYFSVAGPLNMARCPQGHPIVFQAGSSAAGQTFAAKHADVVLTVQLNIEIAKSFYSDVKKEVSLVGRNPCDCKIMPGLLPVVGSTEKEAQEKLVQLASYIEPDSAYRTMADRIGHDFSSYVLDGPIPDVPLSKEVQGYARMMLSEEYRATHTLRDLYNQFAVSRGYLVMTGTPVQIADEMQRWVDYDACDGFIVAPAHFPKAMSDFVDHVVPVLQKRGAFRKDYGGPHLRDHLGIPVRDNSYM